MVATCESTEMETALHDALKAVEHQAIRAKDRYATVRQNPKAVEKMSEGGGGIA
jgi:ribosome-associated translation inhibitor RaiA